MMMSVINIMGKIPAGGSNRGGKKKLALDAAVDRISVDGSDGGADEMMVITMVMVVVKRISVGRC